MMINKLNFENISPFRKVSGPKQAAYSGSKTSRDYDNEQRSYIQKSARNLQQSNIQIYSHNNTMQGSSNVLSSSTRLNSMPANHTPKKENHDHLQPRHQHTANPPHVINLYCKTHENIAPSPHQRSTTMINIKQKENIASESKGEQLKCIRNEIESYKLKEIKYLVKITTLEKDLKKMNEQCQKVEQENKVIKSEFINLSKHQKRSTTPSKREELQSSGQLCTVQKVDKAIQVSSQNKSEQQIIILEEYTKLLKKKLREFEQQGHKKNISQCPAQPVDSKLRQNYDNLKKQFKDIVARYYQCEKDSFEIRSESKFLKDYLKGKILYSTRSTQSSEQKLAQSSSKNFSTCTDFDETVPSFLKALNLPNMIEH